MLLFVEFDVSADIIDVPQSVIDNRDVLRRRFLKWLYDKSIKHKYWITFKDGSKGVIYRSDAFVEWLNKKILIESEEKAIVIRQYVSADNEENLPSIFF